MDSVDWSIDWLNHELIEWLIDWLVDWSIVSVVDWLADCVAAEADYFLFTIFPSDFRQAKSVTFMREGVPGGVTCTATFARNITNESGEINQFLNNMKN